MSAGNHEEELARRLLEEPPSNWPGELSALRVEQRKLPPALRARLDQLAQTPPGRPDAALPGRRRFFLASAAGIAATMALVSGIAIYFYAGRLSTTEELTVRFVFVQGGVRVSDRPASTGASLKAGDRLSLSPDAVAVIGAGRGAAQAELRLRSQAQANFWTLRPDHFELELSRGVVFAQMDPADGDSSFGRRPGLVIRTTRTVSSISGTKFSIELNDPGDARLSTYEGNVRFRRRLAALEELPPEVVAGSAPLTEALKILEQAAVLVAAGAESEVTRSDFERRIGLARLLLAALELPAVSGLRGKTDASVEDIRTAQKALSDFFADAGKKSQAIEEFRSAFGDAPLVRNVAPFDLDERQASLETMSDAEREARYEELRARVGSMDRAAFQREARQALGRSPQEIRLKSGEIVYGSVFGVEGRYKVYTAGGIRMLAPEEIEEIKFE